MTDTTLRLLVPGGAIQDGDLYLTRQGSDTSDTSVLASQIKTYAQTGVLKPGDNVSELVNDAGYINSTSGDWTGTFDGQEGSWYLDRANHTGTQAATTIGAGTVNDAEYGYLDGVTSSIQTQLDGKQATLTTGNLTANSPLSFNNTRQVIGGAAAVSIADAAADGSTKGAAAFNASDFNSSLGVISLDYTNGQAASGSTKGYLTSADWTTFNSKQAAGNYITALTGDVAASGPGSVAATLATVNSNVGSFGSSTSIPSFTVNGKGLITAASGNAVIAPAGTLTGATLASNVLASSLTSVGTLTGGATGAGFTVALGTSTLTGDLPFANLTQIAGFSILAKADTGTGDVAALSAGTDGALRRSGSGNLAFGSLVTNNYGDDSVTYAKIQNVSATNKILGRTSAGAGDIEELSIGTGVAAFLATPSSANLAAALTDETGSGKAVFDTSPTLVTPNIGAASGTSLTLSGLTSGRIPYATTAGLLTDSNNFKYDGTTFTTGVLGRITTTNASFALTQTDTSGTLFNANYTSTTTTNATKNNFAYDADVLRKVASGVTDSGRVTGMRFNVLRNYTTTADSGTLALLEGLTFQYGNFNSDAAATPTTTTVTGLTLTSQPLTGTITALTDISIGQGGSGATVTTHTGISIGSLTGTTTKAIVSSTSSGTNKWNLYIDGTADNYLNGNVFIGGQATRATTQPTNTLSIYNGTAPVGAMTNGISLYSTAGELRVMDAAGNATLLSPHDKKTNEWVFDSKDTNTGKRLRIDVEKMLRFLNEKFGTDFIHEYTEAV